MTDDVRQGAGREPMTWLNGKMVPRREAERILKAEAAGTPPPGRPVPVPVPTPAGVPDETDPPDDDEVQAQASTAPGPGGPHPDVPVSRTERPVQTVAPQARTSVSVPLIEGVRMEISAAPGGGWVTRFTRSGETLAEEKSDMEPWADPRVAGRLTRALAAATPLKETAIRTAIADAFEGIRDSPDGEVMVSEPAACVIGATVGVDIEMTDPPATVVKLDDGGTMIFSSREIAALQPITLNERWYALRRKLLQATRRDFKQIAEYWLSIAEEVEPLGARSVWERITEDLATKIASLPAEEDRDALIRYGIWQEPGGPLWVTSTLIQEVIRDAGKNEYDPGFSRYLKKEGILIENSRRFRVGNNVQVRAWGLDPAFKPETEVVTSVPLGTDQEERS